MSESISEDIQLRYAHWKKNTKLLYDYLNTNTSKWPSLSCQWFPDLDIATDTHRLLLTNFTSGQIPTDESTYISNISTSNHLSWSNLNNFNLDELEFKPDNSIKFPTKNLSTLVNIKFPFGDCNKARYMPQNFDIIGAASSNGSVYIFDRTKHGSRRANSSEYDARFYTNQSGSSSNLLDADNIETDNIETDNIETLSLAWNTQKEGLLLSSYSNGGIKAWDLKRFNQNKVDVENTVWQFETFDDQGANDIDWCPNHDSLFIACGEQTDSLALFDIRTKNSIKSKIRSGLHNGAINSCKFNLDNDFLIASGDSNGIINFWDIRLLSGQNPLMSVDHGSSISTLEWNPNLPTVLATAGQDDGLVKLWDIATDDTKDNLLFVHAGHMLGVNDISWNLNDPWLVSSVSNDNSIHIWKPSANLVETL